MVDLSRDRGAGPQGQRATDSQSSGIIPEIRPVEVPGVQQLFYVDAMGRRRRRGYESHGWSKSSEYRVWSGMIKRCENPGMASFARYGARGIRVCREWRMSFVAFLRDVGPRPSSRHSLDRIDNDGDYKPGNVRWVTATVQMRNTSENRLLTWRGETLNVTEWSERTGIPRHCISQRFHRGWSVERCLTVPLGKAPRGRFGWGRRSKVQP